MNDDEQTLGHGPRDPRREGRGRAGLKTSKITHWRRVTGDLANVLPWVLARGASVELSALLTGSRSTEPRRRVALEVSDRAPLPP